MFFVAGENAIKEHLCCGKLGREMRKESTFRLSLLFQWVPWKPAMFSKMHNSNTKNVQLLKWLHRCLTYTACRFIHAHGGERKKALPGKLRIKDPECKFNLATCRCLHRTCHLDSCRISPKVKSTPTADHSCPTADL